MDVKSADKQLLFYAWDAEADAQHITSLARTAGVDLELERSPAENPEGAVWPRFDAVEAYRTRAAIGIFLLSPAMNRAISLNGLFSQAIYERITAGNLPLVVHSQVRDAIPGYFRTARVVDIDKLTAGHFATRATSATEEKKKTVRIRILDILQRCEPNRSVVAVAPNRGTSRASVLGYEIIEISHRLVAQDKLLVAAFLSDSHSFREASEDIFARYGQWNQKTARIAIIRRPRLGISAPSTTLENVAELLKLPVENVFYLPDYLRRQSTIFRGATRGNVRLDELFVPLEANVRGMSAGNETTADALGMLENWRKTPDKPVLVISGAGGTGKTELLRVATGKWNETDHVRAYSTGSAEFLYSFISTIRDRPISPYDLYRACLSPADVLLDEASFLDQWTQGNVVIGIDGIDEITARTGHTLTGLLRQIEESDTEGAGKIILTARDYLVDKEALEGGVICQIQRFDQDRARRFFRQTFAKQQPSQSEAQRSRQVEKAMEQARELQRGEKDSFLPYVLEVIAHTIVSPNPCETSASSTSDRVGASLAEYVVAQVFEREAIRIGDAIVGVEQQERIFELLAATSTSGVKRDEFKTIVETASNAKISGALMDFLCSHLLLARGGSSDKEVEVVKFRYDFHADFFLARATARFVRVTSAASLSDVTDAPILGALAERYAVDDPLIVDTARLLAPVPYIDLVSNVLQVLSTLSEMGGADQNVSAALLNLVARHSIIGQEGSVNTLTLSALVEDLYGSERGSVINGLVVSRLAKQRGMGLALDFSDRTFVKCKFDHYDEFWLGRANDHTKFQNCTISACHSEGETSLRREMFDGLCTLDDDATSRLAAGNENAIRKSTIVKEALRTFLRTFRAAMEYKGHVSANESKVRFIRLPVHGLISLEAFIDALTAAHILIWHDDASGVGHYRIAPAKRRAVAQFVEQALADPSLRQVMDNLIGLIR